MDVATVTTADRSLLTGVRRALADADEALLCVAFVHSRGVHLVEKELKDLASRRGTRLLVTTTFDQSGGSALAAAFSCGVRVRTLNPGSGSTYHPKVYLGRKRRVLTALVGSANLTGGLATNVEVGVLMRGRESDRPLASLWEWAETTWRDPRGTDWQPSLANDPGDDPLQLADVLERECSRNPVFETLGPRPAQNRVAQVTASGVYVETKRTAARGRPPELIPAWMFNIALDHLRVFGSLPNKTLLEHLRVHRSSAVCAILARLPGFERMPGREVGVRVATPLTPGPRGLT